MLFLQLKFGDPWLWTTSLNAQGWGGDKTLGTALSVLSGPFRPDALATGAYRLADWMHFFFLLLAAVLCAWGARRMGVAYTAYTLVTLGIYLRVWWSAGRYLSVNFPMFIVAGLLLVGRPWRFGAVAYACVLLLSLLTFLFNHGYWVS